MGDPGRQADGRVVFFETTPREQAYFSEVIGALAPTFHPTPLDGATADLAAEAEVVSVFIHSRVDRGVLEHLPRLRLIATRSTGYDHIDLAACAARGVVVANVPFYGETSVAEHTFGLILALSRNIHRAYVRTQRGDFSLAGLEGFDLRGKTLGVVGTGSIGLHVIRIAKGFGMEVVAYDRQQDRILPDVLGYRYIPLEELLAVSDIVSLHVPYLAATHHLMNRERFARMKRGALLINTARGGLVDTEALMWALDEGILAGAGLDVLEGEELIQEESQLLTQPAVEDKLRALLRQHLLVRRENVVVTPHIAFYSTEAVRRIMDETSANIQSFLEGHPRNVVGGAAPTRA
ncbi:MAG: hydroxyacid dehydrogenase [Sphaerobacter sp.]|nr:hydroxyacid dehydrogenase [Sphaerobacter sp.]